MTTELCKRPIVGGKHCGKKTGHVGHHESEEALTRARAKDLKRSRARNIPGPRKPAQISMRVGPERLPGAALTAMKNYKQAGLLHDGDTTFYEIGRRLAKLLGTQL